MNADHVNSIWRGLRWVFAVALVIAALGCTSARDLAAPVDPMGTVARNIAVEKAADETKSLLEAFDVEELNAAVQDVSRVTDQVSQRLDAVQVGDIQSISADLVDSMMLVRAQLDRMQLVEAVDSLREVAEGIDAKVKTLDFQRANEVFAEAGNLVKDVRTEVLQLTESLDGVIDNLGRLIDKAGDKIESFPVEALREDLDTLKNNLDSIDKATKSFESASQRAGTTFLAATVTLGMISLCALVWFVKNIRRRPV